MWNVSIPSTSGQWFPLKIENLVKEFCFDSLNPFYIRSMISTILEISSGEFDEDDVSIPSTSGQWFPHNDTVAISNDNYCCVSIPSTSGQWFPQFGTDLWSCRYNCLNPFYIRSMISTRYSFGGDRPSQTAVSIPSTSGQWFPPVIRLLNAGFAQPVSIPSTSGQWFPRCSGCSPLPKRISA